MFIEFDKAHKRYLAAYEYYSQILDERAEHLQKKKKAGDFEERIREAQSILNERQKLRERLKIDLYESNDTKDKIYRMRFVSGKNVHWIAATTGLCESHIYRILEEIKREMEKGT